MDECLLLYTIPSMGYFNMTSFLIQSRDNINNIMSDPETVEDIKAGKCGFIVTSFISERFKRTGYSIEFVEK